MATDPPAHGPRWLLAAVRAAAPVVEGVAFWIAVALPLVYVPLLAAGVVTATDWLALAGLLAANAAAIVLGYGHRKSANR